ncbi:MAG TPA: hypothetical protein DCX80_05770, partial [Chloroflexi bacterium]|nr:hypothetical protein [Chloroflexota bacterium]
DLADADRPARDGTSPGIASRVVPIWFHWDSERPWPSLAADVVVGTSFATVALRITGKSGTLPVGCPTGKPTE